MTAKGRTGRTIERNHDHTTGYIKDSKTNFNKFVGLKASLVQNSDRVIAHRCTIFLCYLGCEIQHRVVTPYSRLQIRNEAPEAKIDQIGPGFLQNVHTVVDSKKHPFFGPHFHFFGCQGDLFLEGVTFFQDCGLFSRFVDYA